MLENDFYRVFKKLCDRHGSGLTDLRRSQKDEWFEYAHDLDDAVVTEAMDKLARTAGQYFPTFGQFCDAVRGARPKLPQVGEVQCGLCDGKGMIRLWRTPSGLIPAFAAVQLDEWNPSNVECWQCPACVAGSRYRNLPRLTERECIRGTFAELQAYHREPFVEPEEASRRMREIIELLRVKRPDMARAVAALENARTERDEQAIDRLFDPERRRKLQERRATA